MVWNFDELNLAVKKESSSLCDKKGLEAFRIKYLGKKGLVSEMFSSLAKCSKEEKPALGKNVNLFRHNISQLIEAKKDEIESQEKESSPSFVDVGLPGVSQSVGHRHILTQTIEEVCSLFENLGFCVQESPEIETEFYNFTALNIPEDHPSRDGFDTFYLKERDLSTKDRYHLLRSHTSPGQIRIMKENRPPLAVIIPGKVYRPDAVDASHSFMFHQIEGLLVDEKIQFSDLKGLLTSFCKKLFGKDIKMRFRPHFFPFTEPSAEVDISCYICNAKGCSVCGQNGWLEIMGCGMVHPQVFKLVGYPKGKYSGIAFGLGVERIAMLRHGINDIRILFENDKRFLEQF